MVVSVTAVFLAGAVCVLLCVAAFLYGFRIGTRVTLQNMAGEIAMINQLQELYVAKLAEKPAEPEA